jgi:hypothetical protein
MNPVFEPEVVAGVIRVLQIVRVPAQGTKVLHQHKGAIKFASIICEFSAMRRRTRALAAMSAEVVALPNSGINEFRSCVK